MSRRRSRSSVRNNLDREPSVLTHSGMPSGYGITARELLAMNEDGREVMNKAALEDVGGPSGLAEMLATDLTQGIPPEDNLDERAREFGRNWMPTPDPKTWLQLFFESFNDTTLIILIVSAFVSLGKFVFISTNSQHTVSDRQIGFYGDPEKGWVEGAAILCAVLVVAVVTATNDYSKDKQFRALNSVKDDVKVVRGGEILEMSTRLLLVGDLVLMEAGDKIPADGVLVEGTDVTVNESSLTGEAEEVRKGGGEGEDVFLLSGCTLTGGRASMMTIAVGAESRWGRIKVR
ncbi:unnamed protein product, partial [Discosporangium mesarthrocarpum]